MTANGIDVKNCQYFNSNTFPLKVVLNSAQKDHGIIQIIYKVKVLVKTKYGFLEFKSLRCNDICTYKDCS